MILGPMTLFQVTSHEVEFDNEVLEFVSFTYGYAVTIVAFDDSIEKAIDGDNRSVIAMGNAHDCGHQKQYETQARKSYDRNIAIKNIIQNQFPLSGGVTDFKKPHKLLILLPEKS